MDFPPFSQLKEKFVNGFKKTLNGLRGDSPKAGGSSSGASSVLMGLLFQRIPLQKSLQGRNLHQDAIGVS